MRCVFICVYGMLNNTISQFPTWRPQQSLVGFQTDFGRCMMYKKSLFIRVHLMYINN